MKNMRGIVDPWTLGFIISIFGSIASYIAHSGDKQNTVTLGNDRKPIELSMTSKTHETNSIIIKR